MQELQNAGFSLLGMAMMAVVVGAAAIALGRRRDVYLYGLAAMMAAFIASLIVITALAAIWPRMGGIWWVVLGGPAIEEMARIAAVVMVSVALQQRRDWVLFGLGFALLETALKFSDALIAHGKGGFSSGFLPIALLVPLVPLLLHVFLSLVAIALFRRGLSLGIVFAATFALHALHNASIAFGWWQPADLTGAYLTIALQCGLFLALITLVLRASARLRRVTSSPPHANSGA